MKDVQADVRVEGGEGRCSLQSQQCLVRVGDMLRRDISLPASAVGGKVWTNMHIPASAAGER